VGFPWNQRQVGFEGPDSLLGVRSSGFVGMGVLQALRLARGLAGMSESILF
jgi:hypothetical protein